VSKRDSRKKRSKKGKNRGSEQLRSSADLPLPPDHRAMEKTMSEITGWLEGQEFGSMEEAQTFLNEVLEGGELPSTPPPTTPLEKAQDLIYQAAETTGKKRVELARKALKTSKDCADAYVILVEETAHSPEEARELYERGVKAGERALGPEVFEEDAGHFWGILETRPYMRTRQGLALCLWAVGEEEEAIGHYREMLRLNPNDNQGIRDLLATALVEMARDEELGELLERYEDEAGATWAYTRALWMFRREGATEGANAALEEAMEANPFVPLYVLGEKKLPNTAPPLVGLGEESEAIHYFAEALTGWLRTPGAIEWLRENAADMVGPQSADTLGDGAEVIPLPTPQRPAKGRIEELQSLMDEDDEDEEELLAPLEATEAAAVELLGRALPELQGVEPPREELATAAQRLRTGLARGGWPYGHMLGASGWAKDDPPADDAKLWLGGAGALISPREETSLDAEEEAAIIALDPADWLGAVIGVVREGVGADASPEALLGYIDACPEIEGTINPDEAPLLEMAFELILPAWEAAGAVDDSRRLTALGRWGLPRALAWAWGHHFDEDPAPGPAPGPAT
jgi:tetratricopeptide (TPR) repeat protein